MPTRSSIVVSVISTIAVVLAATAADAQLPINPAGLPFDMVGFIQKATLNDPTDVFSGGTVTLNNHVVIVPRNTILQMPATSLTWAEVFKLAPPPYGPTQSGLALADTPKPFTTYELHVQGNRVGDLYIAGLLFISQQSLNTGQGFINFIDYGTGELRVGGVQGDATTGARVRINDPIGRFGRAGSPDVRLTIDEDNPTVRSETGYPMCIPRLDPGVADDSLCPQANRPVSLQTHTYKSIFTMRNGNVVPDTDCLNCDPAQQAPFEIGDYVTYAGAMFKDGVGTYISASQIIGNVGIFTAPGTQPVYVAIDVILQGVAGAAIAGLPQEAASRTRVEGFTTDPSMPVDIYAVDVDACTGANSDRFWATQAIDQGPPKGAVRGRFRFRPGAIAKTNIFLPPVREVHVASEGGVVSAPVANGLWAGQYHAPNFQFIFPENLGIGNPAVPANFQDFPFLAGGSGPWSGGGPYGTALPQGVVQQLSPWPGASIPALAGCSATLPKTNPPDAEAGADRQILSGDAIDLDGSLSKDRNSPEVPLTFAWKQIGGPSVTLQNANNAKTTFTAPLVPANADPLPLEFLLTVTNGTYASTATVTTTVKPGLPPNVIVGSDQTVAAGKTVTLDASASTDPNKPPFQSPMAFTWTQTGGTPLPAGALTNANTSKASFVAPAGPGVLTFTVTVDNGAVPKSASTNVTVIAAPIANAGPDQSVAASATVTLDATGSTDPNTPALPLTYSWQQLSGTSVNLSDNKVAQPTFTAPSVSDSLVFRLTADNGTAQSTATVTVTINAPAQQ